MFIQRVEGWIIEVPFTFKTSTFSCLSLFSHDLGRWEVACIHRHLFHSKIYTPSSSLLEGKHLPFSPSPLRLNIFRLFVILSLTQLYRYTPEVFLFSTAAFNIPTGPPSDELDENSQRTWLSENFSHWNRYSHFRFALDFSYAFGIL
jgi:hypothetical protein